MNLKMLLLLCLTSGAALAQAPASAGPLVSPSAPITMPEPSFAPAGAGASHGMLVEPEKESVPRSPNKRVLPASDEPGVWAADEDPALAMKRPPGVYGPEILNFQYPYPPGTARTDAAEAPTRNCAAIISHNLPTRALWEVPSLEHEDRQCLFSRLMAICAATRLEEYPHMKEAERRRWKLLFDAARARASQPLCVELSSNAEALFAESALNVKGSSR